MKKTSTFALTVAILLTGTPAQSAPETPKAASQPAVASVVTPPVQVVHADSEELVALTEWALSQFSQAGLELPNTDIYFHASNAGCKGHVALHTRRDNQSRIDVCKLTRTPHLETTMLHELAHAWAAHTLTNQDRKAFVESQGLDSWHDASWSQRGTEQAATIVAWGLNETSHRPRNIQNNDLDSLIAAYQQLTGTTPLTDTTPEWKPGDPITG